MSSKLTKILSIIVGVLAVLGIIFFVMVVSASDDAEALSNAVGTYVGFSQLLLYVTIITAILLSILGLAKNPENLKKTFLGLAILGALLLVSYLISDSGAVLNSQGAVIPGGEEGAASNKWTSTGIWFSVVLLAVGAFFFVIDLVKSLVKS